MYLDHLKLSISNGKDSTEFWAAGLDLNVVTITSDDVKLLWVCSVPDNCKQGPFLGGWGWRWARWWGRGRASNRHLKKQHLVVVQQETARKCYQALILQVDVMHTSSGSLKAFLNALVSISCCYFYGEFEGLPVQVSSCHAISSTLKTHCFRLLFLQMSRIKSGKCTYPLWQWSTQMQFVCKQIQCVSYV